MTIRLLAFLAFLLALAVPISAREHGSSTFEIAPGSAISLPHDVVLGVPPPGATHATVTVTHRPRIEISTWMAYGSPNYTVVAQPTSRWELRSKGEVVCSGRTRVWPVLHVGVDYEPIVTVRAPSATRTFENVPLSALDGVLQFVTIDTSWFAVWIQNGAVYAQQLDSFGATITAHWHRPPADP